MMPRKNLVLGLSMALFMAQTQAQTAFSMDDWSKKDPAFRRSLVESWVEVAAQDKVTIRLPVAHYVRELDQLVASYRANGVTRGLQRSVGISLKTIAVMDCDWDDGSDRLAFATRYLGQDNLAQLRQYQPDKFTRLQNGCQ